MSHDSKSTIVARAPQVAEIAAQYSDEAETARQLSPQVVRAVRDAGFARHFVPAAHGGETGGFAELTSAVALVGEGCTSAAWAASLAAYAGRYAAFLPEAGQAEIWAEGPDVVLAGALMPSGKAEPVAGGWRLSGEWKYISGVHFADWALACAAVPAKDAENPPERPEVLFFAVPRADFSIEDTWSTVGMRGTGSHTLLLSDVFVPDHLTLPRSAVHAGRAPASDARCHIVPMYAVNALPFAAPLIGAARGALRAWIARTGQRVDRRGRAVREMPSAQVSLARSAAEVDAAELLILRTAAVADGTECPPEGEAAVRGARDLALAVELLVSAVDRVFRASGTSGQSSSDPVQRFWRDVNSAASHVALSFETTGAAYGAWALSDDKGDKGDRRAEPVR
ncbi:acyl-CoA dehydrogenase family protein [Streptomyces sp. NBC_00620]|uniref:acyl-CoA dehydrogenase family protein n=1 Tax=Streptomyces sp. NBC_00620 TaxID=2903666 RepID=UPI0022548038|nr:acyl-CoA dehydrogenase family protein [Streptomyces sp. NBC_00620]MCX4975130.1 acyl-CoA dehydrogenase family protein [Streptomyces sp. NBC_00620]